MSTSLTSNRGRLEKCGLAIAVALGTIGGLSQNAHAVTTEFALEGYLNAPIIAERTHSTGNTHFVFQQYIDRGDLILSYDDNNTTGIGDDIVRINGTTEGGVCHRSQDCRRSANFHRYHRTGDGVYFGSGDFSWDLMFANPLAGTTDPGNFLFGAQDAGDITLLNAPRNVPTNVDVMLKEHPDLQYAFKLNPDGDGFVISSWLLTQNGVVFGHARAESLRNEAVFNSHLRAYCISGDCRQTTEVPEPMTMGLLGAGLLGGVGIRRRKQMN